MSPRPVLAAALLLALAPAGAGAQTSHQHDLQIDKSEKFVDLDPLQSETHTMSCPSGQIVLNGSVKVDAVDSPGFLTGVETLVSRGFGPQSWRFVVHNNNLRGRAQVKLFIVCMATAAGTHQVLLGEPGSDPATAIAETSETWGEDGSTGSGFGNELSPSCPGTPSATGVYPDTTLFPVRPSFSFSPSAGEMYTSDPLRFSASGSGPFFGLQSRDWQFAYDTGAADIATTAQTSIRCLGTHVSAAGGHRHAYDVSYQRVIGNIAVPAGTRIYDMTVPCPKRNGTFGIIGVHSELGGGVVIGSEPRGDVWAFRLSNPGATQALFQLGVICLEKRTWSSTGAVPPPAPTPQSVDTKVTTKRVGIAANRTQTFDVRCGDKARYVLSGAVSIDRVNRGDIGVFEDIVVTQSRPLGLNRWRFTVANGAVGGANFSLRLVCLAPWTEGHGMVLSGVETGELDDGTVTCANGQFPFQAGYSEGVPTLLAPGGTGEELDPSQRFAFTDGPAKVWLACLFDRTTIRSNHYHRAFAHRHDASITLPAGIAKVLRVRCDPGHVAVAGGLDVRGTETRTIQSNPAGRSWRFQLVSLAKPAKVTGYATCVKKKTTGELFDI